MSEQQQRVVIIGVGAVSEAIAQSVRAIDGAQLVGGACRTKEKGEKFAAKHGCKWYADGEEMLAKEKPDVAVIASPTGAHLDGVLACCRHKVHVLCEKPLEINIGRIDRMIGAARDAGIILGGIFPQRFNAPVRAIRDAAAAGRFGALSVITTAVPWWREDSYYDRSWHGTLDIDGGGALINQGSHSVDMLQWIAAATMPDIGRDANPVDEVFAFTARRAHDAKILEAEDTCLAVLRFQNGALGQILSCTSMYPGTHRRLIVSGRDGLAELVEDQIQKWQFRDERPEDATVRERFGSTTKHAGGSSNPMAFDFSNHQRNLEAFLKAVREGREPELSAREAAKAVAIIEACYESARAGGPVKVK